ncbi:hypothetical protein [Pseudomonas mandelii]|uniref:hypothetical protein n=1 Tax=Pseudomonas mandelii TaxID=75612 RepID=UPI00209E9860|nr:hypothetical protein [Pseudomonas mandelii]MCO8310905.1 hypothetical protein [Pseudomonas mandelii]
MESNEFNAYKRKAVSLLAEEVKSFYCQRFQDAAQDLKIRQNNVTVRVKSEWKDLYIRIQPMRDGRVKLIIARISFSERRAGHGTALVAHLAQSAPNLGHEYIEIESVNDESKAFAIRLGMHESEPDCYIADLPTLLNKIGCSSRA